MANKPNVVQKVATRTDSVGSGMGNERRADPAMARSNPPMENSAYGSRIIRRLLGRRNYRNPLASNGDRQTVPPQRTHTERFCAGTIPSR